MSAWDDAGDGGFSVSLGARVQSIGGREGNTIVNNQHSPVEINEASDGIVHCTCQNRIPLVIVVMGGVIGLSQANGFILNADGK